jgi:hypothetical protein
MDSNELTEQEKEFIKQKALFLPCKTKLHLKQWLKIYLDIELPDNTVDAESNTNPFDLIWEIYSAALENRSDYSRVLTYASRESFKTLDAAILEVLALLHLERDVIHLAAIEQQSQKAQSYVQDFFSRPIINRFVTKQNERRVEITKFINKNTGQIIALSDWEKLQQNQRDFFSKEMNYCQIIVATMKSTNSEHASFCVIDEFDLMDNPKVVEEAKMIPGIDRKGHNPITLITSSRKSTYGFVQAEIEKAHKTGTKILHWNIMEIMQQCPPERHLPDEPKIPIYVSEDSLESIPENEYHDLPIEQKDKFVKHEGFKGCLQNCSLFPVCRGRAATHQTSKISSLKPINFVISRFKEVETEVAKAQLACWRPMTSGLVYPRFDRNVHVLTLDKIYERVLGHDLPQNVTKKMFLAYLKAKGFQFYTGIDFGFTHAFSAVTAFVHQNICYVIDTISEKELEIMEKIEVLNDRIKYLEPILYPDPESPSDIKTLQKHGYKCKSFEKDVIGGINAVRSKLKPSLGMPPQLFFLGNDKGVEVLTKSITTYHWKTDINGNWTDRPAAEGADECFTAETEFLTKNGWKSLEQATVDDVALVVDNQGNALWEKPTGIVKKFYDGKVYKVLNKDIEFTSTENHEHAVVKLRNFLDKKFDLHKMKLSEIDKKMLMLKVPVSIRNESQTIGPLWSYFVGCSFARIFDENLPRMKIKINKLNEKTVLNILEKLGLNVGINEENCVNIRTYPSELDSLFDVFISSNRTYLVWNLTENECMSILQGFYDSLGLRSFSLKIETDKSKKSYLEFIQSLHIKVGGSGVISQNTEKSWFEPSYSGFSMIVPNDIKIENYTGMVYCITTSTGYFLARTNGKVFVAGNCDALRYLITNLFGYGGKAMVSNKDVSLTDGVYDPEKNQYTQENWLQKKISELAGETPEDGVLVNKPGMKIII